MRCYSHLSDDEREQIGLGKALGHSIGAIAQAIGRPKSTISRELSRNKLPSGRYSPLHAAGAYQLRRRREALIERDRALRTFVVDRLANTVRRVQKARASCRPRLREVAMKTLHKRCAGLDVHKAEVVACLRLISKQKVEREVRRFPTT